MACHLPTHRSSRERAINARNAVAALSGVIPVAIYDHNEGPKKYGAGRESPQGFEAFTAYLQLGRQRTVGKAADVSGISLNTCKDLAKRFCWAKRVAQWDADQMKARFEEVRRERETRHRDEINKFRERQASRAIAMGDLADLMLDMTTDKLQAMRAAGEHISEQSIAQVARTVASLADMSMQIQATALGIDDLNEALDTEMDD